MSQKVRLDLSRIFLTPPISVMERVILFVMLAGFFMVFFRPLQFSPMPPLEAAFTAAVPALSLSWGWVVLLRYLFNKRSFVK